MNAKLPEKEEDNHTAVKKQINISKHSNFVKIYLTKLNINYL
jgi:hypothetical protein